MRNDPQAENLPCLYAEVATDRGLGLNGRNFIQLLDTLCSLPCEDLFPRYLDVDFK
jgi:hypothetical protein